MIVRLDVRNVQPHIGFLPGHQKVILNDSLGEFPLYVGFYFVGAGHFRALITDARQHKPVVVAKVAEVRGIGVQGKQMSPFSQPTSQQPRWFRCLE